jgi:hypothetical protein
VAIDTTEADVNSLALGRCMFAEAHVRIIGFNKLWYWYWQIWAGFLSVKQ